MEIEVGVVNGYNNLIQIATEDLQLGFNASVNESERAIFSEITREVSEPDAKDFETPICDHQRNQQTSEATECSRTL